MADDYTEKEKGLLQLKSKINKPVLNALFHLAPSVTSPPFPSTFQLSPLIWDTLLGAIWRVEGLEGDGIGNVQKVKTTSCRFIFSPRMLSKTCTPPLLALRLSESLLLQIIPLCWGDDSRICNLQKLHGKPLTSSIHFVLLISLFYQTSSFWHWDS